MSNDQKYVPPTPGTPCWIEIPALSVPRAKHFYSSVFGWKFRDAAEDATLAHFSFPDSRLNNLFDGGIHKVENPESHSSGKKMTSIYLYVESIDDALDRVSKEGGKRVSEKMSESEHGCYALFEDTEGNVHGVYTWQG